MPQNVAERRNKSPWSDPPLTGTPLDYVPIDAPIRPVAPTRYKAPVWRRAVIAALVAAAFLTPLLWL